MNTELPFSLYAERRSRVAAAHRPERHRPRPDRAGAPAQPRQRFPVPARQLLLLPHRLHRAQCLAGDHRRRQQHAVLRSPRTWSARSGTATASGPEAAPDALGVQRRIPDRRARRAAAPAAGEPRRRLVPVRHPRGPGGARGRLAEPGARARALRRPVPRAAARPVRGARRDAPGQGRARAGHHAARRRASARTRHVRAMKLSARMLREGKDVREYHLDAELLHEFRLGGSQYPAYSSIVAAGANACVLHYRADRHAGARRRAGADRRRLRARWLRQRHHPHLPGRRQVHRPAAHAVRPGARLAGGRRRRHARGRALHRSARRHRQGAGAGHAGCRPARSQQGRRRRRRDRAARLLPVLHAPHRPLAGHGRARLRQLRRAGRGRRGQRAQGPALGRGDQEPAEPHPAGRAWC